MAGVAGVFLWLSLALFMYGSSGESFGKDTHNENEILKDVKPPVVLGMYIFCMCNVCMQSFGLEAGAPVFGLRHSPSHDPTSLSLDLC